MIYSIIVIGAFIVLSILSYLPFKHPEEYKKYFIANLILAISGISLLAISYFSGEYLISKYKTDAELFGWLSDYYSLFYSLAIPTFIFLLVINLISAIIFAVEKRNTHKIFMVIREVVSVLSSALLLIYPYVGYLTQNQYVNMYIYMMLSGIGMALAMRASNAIALIKQKYS